MFIQLLCLKYICTCTGDSEKLYFKNTIFIFVYKSRDTDNLQDCTLLNQAISLYQKKKSMYISMSDCVFFQPQNTCTKNLNDI